MTAAAVFFLALLGAYYVGSITLIITLPAMLTLFWPINGLSVTDRLSGSMVVQGPKPEKR